MGSFFCENLPSESLPYFDRKFVKRRDSGDKRDTGRAGDSEIKLFSGPFVRNISNPIRKAGRTFNQPLCVWAARTQKSFGKRIRDERARSNSGLKVALAMKLRKGKIDGESRDSEVCRERSGRGKSGRAAVEASRN